MIVQVSVDLRRTVCVDTDCRFDNLSGNHHQINRQKLLKDKCIIVRL